MKKWICISLFICSITSLAVSQSDRFPKYRGWVNDFARVISPYYEEKMELVAAEVKRKTGVEIAVAAVESMNGVSLEEYANRLFETWGIGGKDRDNGLLLLLAVQERQVRIEVGYELEGILSDGRCGQILDD